MGTIEELQLVDVKEVRRGREEGGLARMLVLVPA
jgi:hypothetical protein